MRDSPAGKLATAVIDRLVVPSETVATAIRDSNLQANPVIIDDPIDIEAIKNVAVGDRADIVWTGEDTDTANLEPFLLGLAELRSNEFRAVILTPSSETDAMREAIDQLSLENHVEIIAQPTVRERLAIYRGAKVFVQTAAVCPYPSELVVAMAAGCRAIVQYHERSSAHEIVDRHGRGVFISTPEELADAIRQIARHTLRSRNDSFDRYSTTAVCQRLFQTYDNETDTRQ